MSAAQQHFDRGGVLSRRRAVLTFATHVRVAATRPSRARRHTPTPPPVSLHRATQPGQSDLPVIARIVRRTTVELRAGKRPGRGTILFALLALAILGAIALPAVRSVRDETARLATVEAPALESSASERVFLRVPGAWTLEAPRSPVLVPAPRVLPMPVRPARAPSHAVAAAHRAGKHARSRSVARR
jgi:hypothetical protein